MDNNKKKSRVALLSVASNSSLVAMKLAIGILINSVSVISEAIHSAVDLVAALIAFFAVRTSAKPEDRRHAFGHGKIENISGTIEAVLIFFAAGWIIYEAVEKLKNPQHLEQAGWGIIVMSASVAANFFVSHMLFKVGTETESIALKADAWHLRTDVWTSFGVMAGLAIYWSGRLLFPHINLSWIDPVAAIIVALLIIKAAYDLTRESVRDLLDARLTREDEDLIDRYVTEQHPRVLSYHKLRTRKSGSQRFYEFHLVVAPEMSVQESHEIGDRIVARVKEHYPDAKVVIHVEPCDNTCTEECLGNCGKIEE
ncbi:MAG TPA: cation diffusion facilitator family transporter [Spirochaetota bacterium]|nr:cation diffusion facilitator family transporter [Spirochaetota bacterium]HPV41761.1 cation diffusion facilitator family transporter [Spirochaetota bacterium]